MWVAFDRGVRAVEEHGLVGPTERWRELRDELRAEALERGCDEQLGAFSHLAPVNSAAVLYGGERDRR